MALFESSFAPMVMDFLFLLVIDGYVKIESVESVGSWQLAVSSQQSAVLIIIFATILPLLHARRNECYEFRGDESWTR